MCGFFALVVTLLNAHVGGERGAAYSVGGLRAKGERDRAGSRMYKQHGWFKCVPILYLLAATPLPPAAKCIAFATDLLNTSAFHVSNNSLVRGSSVRPRCRQSQSVRDAKDGQSLRSKEHRRDILPVAIPATHVVRDSATYEDGKTTGTSGLDGMSSPRRRLVRDRVGGRFEG